MDKYFALDTASGDLGLRFIGEFESVFDAIEKTDEKPNQVIWVLSEKDFQRLIYDYTHVTK